MNLNKVLDVDSYFSKRDISNKRDSGLYFIYDPFGRIAYIGEGKTVYGAT